MQRITVFLVAAASVLLAARGAADAADRGALLRAGDALTADLTTSADRDEFTMELSEGANLSVAVTAAKGGLLLVDLELERPDRVVVDPGALLTGRGTAKLALKGYVVPADQTGLWTLVVKAYNGTAGGYTISAKMKAPKPPKVAGLAFGGDGKARVEFTGQDAALVSVKAKVGSGGPVTKAELLDPTGAAIAGSDFTGSLSLASFSLGQGFGRYTVEFTGPTGTTIDTSVTLKAPKPVKRKFVLPGEGSLSAASLVVKQEDVGRAFVLSGANLRSGSSVIVSGEGVSVASISVPGAGRLDVSFDVAAAAPYGARDLTLVPPPLDGEPFLLPASLAVHAPDPTISSVAVGGDGVLGHGDSQEITVTGTGFRSGGTYGFSGIGLESPGGILDSGTRFRFTLTASNAFTTHLGPLDISWTQPAAGGGASATKPGAGAGGLVIHAPAPTVAGCDPSVRYQADAAALVSVTGIGFRPGGSISISGFDLTLGSTTVGSASSATVHVTVPPGATVGARTVTFTQATGESTGASVLTIQHRAPVVGSISPVSVPQNSSGRLTITGSFMRSGGTVTIPGLTLSSPLPGSTESSVRVDYEAGEYAPAGIKDVVYTQPTLNGQTGLSGTLEDGLLVRSPVPTLTGVTGGPLTCGGAGAVLTLAGTNFRDGATFASSATGVSFSDYSRSSDTSATVTATSGWNATVGSASLAYRQADDIGGDRSATKAAAFSVATATPTVSGVSPGTVEQGAVTVPVTLTGTNFHPGGTVSISGTGLTLGTLVVSSSGSATVPVTVAAGATLGKRDVTFTQPAGGGGQAATKAEGLEVVLPVTALSPSQVRPGDTRVSMSIIGAGFDSGTAVSFSGSGITVHSTTFVSASQLTVSLSVASSATIGLRDVTITPGSGPAQNHTGKAAVIPADPTVTGFSHEALSKGASSVSVTIHGTNFRSGDTPSASGSGVTFGSVSVVSDVEITASASVGSGAATGLRDLTVTRSASDGGRSATLPDAFRVTAASPSVSAIVPAAIGRTGSGGATRVVPVTITGTNFMTGASVSVSKSGGSGCSFSGTPVVVSDTEITADLAVAGTATTGLWDVLVTNPGGLGNSGTSGSSLLDVKSESTLVVNRVLPASGATYGGERVTMHGAGFAAGDVVDFGTARGYLAQVIDRNTIVCTVPQPASTSLAGPTAVAVKVTASGGGSATLSNGYAYAKDEMTFFPTMSLFPAHGTTGVPQNLVTACVLLPGPIDASTAVYGGSAGQMFWFESGWYTVTNGARAFGPGNRWLLFTRTGGGSLPINGSGRYILQIPSAIQSVGGAPFTPTRVASNAFDQYYFTLGSGTTDTTAPTLSSITPSNGATGISPVTSIVLVFSEEIDPQFVTTASITLKQGSTTIGATISIDDDLLTVRLFPHTGLAASTTYTVSVTASVTDLFGNAFSAVSRTFTTGSGTDSIIPTIDTVVIEELPASVDGSGTWVDSGGTGGNAFDLCLDRTGFLLHVDFSDEGGAGIDPTTFSAKCSVAVGGASAYGELASNFTVTHTYAEWRIPSGTTVTAGENVTFTFLVKDYSSNTSSSHVITMDVAARSGTSSNGGDLDPFGSREVWVLRTDLDAYTASFTTQSSPAAQGATTSLSPNGVPDFSESLRLVGLWSPGMTSAAAATVNGADTGTNAIVGRLVMERIRELIRERYMIAADGTRDERSVEIEFLVTGEQGTLSSLPTWSPAKSSSTGKAFSELSLGGTCGAETDPWSTWSTLGKAYWDVRNLYSQANINDDGTVGIYLLGILKGEVNYRVDDGSGNATYPFFKAVSAKFVAIHGGTPVGEDASDDDVLADTFDRASSGNATLNARHDDIMDAIETVAMLASATGAHEIGHSVGLMPDGAPKTGLFGWAHYSNTFTKATSGSPNTTHHLDFAGMNNLMAASSSALEQMRTGTEFQRFCPLAIGYLRRVLLHDEAK